MGTDKQTDRQTEGRTNGRTDKRTHIYSIFRDKLSLPEGSLDRRQCCWFGMTWGWSMAPGYCMGHSGEWHWDGLLDVRRREYTNVTTTEIGCQVVLGILNIGEVLRVLKKLDIIFTPKNSVRCHRSCLCCKVQIVQLKLDMDKFDSGTAALLPLAILNWFKDGGVTGACCVHDGIAFCIVPWQERQVCEVCPVAREISMYYFSGDPPFST